MTDIEQYRGWLDSAKIDVAPGMWIEIDHSVIDGPEDARTAGIESIEEAAETIRIAPGAEL